MKEISRTVNILKKTRAWDVLKRHFAITLSERKFWKDDELGKSIFSENKTFKFWKFSK